MQHMREANGEAAVSHPQKPLAMIRAANILSYVEDASSKEQIADAITKAEKIFWEVDTSCKTIRDCWTLVLNGIVPNFPLHQA
jgi:hypothetical protein